MIPLLTAWLQRRRLRAAQRAALLHVADAGYPSLPLLVTGQALRAQRRVPARACGRAMVTLVAPRAQLERLFTTLDRDPMHASRRTRPPDAG